MVEENMVDDDIYFAKKPVEDIGSEIMEKVEEYYAYLTRSGLSTLWNNSHNQYFEAKLSSGEMYRTGEHSEYLSMPANHYKNLLTHVKILTTNQRPALKPRAVNTDTKSTAACKLASSLLDYYMREQKVEQYLKEAVESGLKYGEAFILTNWDMHSGEDYTPENGVMLKSGDLKVKCYMPHFMVRDFTVLKADENLWYVAVDFVNKYELAAQYPDMKKEIKDIGMNSTYFTNLNSFYSESLNESETVAVYTFLHKRSSALPEGRETILLDSDLILSDGPLPYKQFPISRLAPEESDFSQFGYSPMFDILAIQECLTALYSCVTTNLSSFAVTSILIPRGFNISVDSLTGGLNLIEYDPSAGGKPEPINFAMTAPEVYRFIQQLETLMQTLIGLSDVNRGIVPPNIKSGNALALLASQAIEFNSGLQNSYISLLEQVGTSIIYVLKDFAQTPRIATISGKYNQSYLKEFRGEDLSLVNRVQVDVINPLSKTTSGKLELANFMLDKGWIKNPQQYEMVLETGNLDFLMETDIKELYQMRSENELMMSGQTPTALILDNHLQHISEHKSVLGPESRKDPVIVKAVVDHIMVHIDLLKTGDPILLQLLGQKPLGPTGPAEGSAPIPAPPAASIQGMPGAQAPEMAEDINPPKMPTNPLSGKEFDNETGGL